jgi:ABC-type lipoprotein release transport system permease subunit
MGSISIAWKDITRKPERSLLYMVTQSLLVATGGNLFLLSTALVVQVRNAEQKFNGLILRIMSQYIDFLIFFTLIASIITASVLASLLTISRMDDLAVFQSIGGTFKQIQRIPIAEIFLITVFGGGLGVVEGLFGGYILQVLLGFQSIHISIFQYFLFSSLFVGLSIIGTYFTSGFFVNILIRKKFQEILDGQFEITRMNPKRVWGIPAKGKTAFRFGHLFQSRGRLISRVMILGILILTLISSFGILGGSIIQNTTDSYIERGYGFTNDVNQVIVVTPSITFSSFLEGLYDSNYDLTFNLPIEFKTEIIPSTFLNQLSQLVTKSTFESRLLTVGTFRMLGEYRVINNSLIGLTNETLKSYVWGIDASFGEVFDYFSVGIEYDTPSNDDIFIADGYQLKFQKNCVQKLLFKSIDGLIMDVHRFDIMKMMIDPFAKGFCTYVNINTLKILDQTFNKSQRNVVFIRNPDPAIVDLIKENNLTFFDLQPHIDNYTNFSNYFWLLSNIAFAPVVVAIGLALVAFSSIYALILKNDLYIMRILGGRKRILKRILLWINAFVSIQGGFAGILLGFSLAFSLLIPDPVFPVIQSWIILVLSLGGVALFIERYLSRYIRVLMN